MQEPKFSESQLQQAANAAFIQRVSASGFTPPFVYVPSLIAEHGLGWDSAAYLPWLPIPPDPENEGCNFFVQYKLSLQLNTSNAKEWHYWGDDYFRFKIPHASRPHGGPTFDDFHQWERLKDLADNGFPTFYATNGLLAKNALISQYRAGTLLHHVPVLDVRTVASKHRHVTFRPGAPHFRLHSELEEVPMRSFSRALDALVNEDQMSLEKATDLVVEALLALRPSDDRPLGEELFLEVASKQYVDSTGDKAGRENRRMRVLVRRLGVMAAVQRHLGAFLLWCPKGS